MGFFYQTGHHKIMDTKDVIDVVEYSCWRLTGKLVIFSTSCGLHKFFRGMKTRRLIGFDPLEKITDVGCNHVAHKELTLSEKDIGMYVYMSCISILK